MFALGLPLTCAALAALSLGMDRHHRQVRGRSATRIAAWLYRGIGAAALVGSLLLFVAGSGTWTGSVEWLGTLTLGALAVALSLAARPRALPLIVTATFALGGIAIMST